MTEQEAIEILTLSDDMKKELPNLKDVYEVAVNALEEIQKYRALGTVEELREARENQVPKKPREYEDKYYGCPVCGNVLLHKWLKYPTQLANKTDGLPYCLGCGQAIDWSDTE